MESEAKVNTSYCQKQRLTAQQKAQHSISSMSPLLSPLFTPSPSPTLLSPPHAEAVQRQSGRPSPVASVIVFRNSADATCTSADVGCTKRQRALLYKNYA